MDTNPTPVPTPIPPSEELPEKYIRTFANDMEIFQKGGTPGLAPLKEQQAFPAERLVEASPLAFTPIQVPSPAPEPVVPAPLPAEPLRTTPIKTYSEDFRERMKETQASTATILAAEQDAARPFQAAPETGKRNNRNIWYIIAGVVLLVAGGIGVYLAYARYQTALAPVIVAPVASTPIFVDSREKVAGTGTALVQAINQSVATSMSLNTVRLLSFDVATAGVSIFSALGTRAPSQLLRNVDAARSMAGIVNTSSGQSPFFILSVASYSATFSGMLSWEPLMQSDFGVLFPLYPAPVIPAPTLATTTAKTVTKTTQKLATTTVVVPALVTGFRDEVVSNHDVRIYRDAQGRSILLYGYWNQTTLIIARDPAAFAEILARLATSHS